MALNALVLEPLVDVDPNTYEVIPLLAESYSVSKDKKTFTFKLNPNARFSDGKPVTSADVTFTWDTIMNPKNKTAPFQSEFGSFESCTALDEKTVVFKAKTRHFKNLEKLRNFLVLPKHFYSAGDFNKGFSTRMLGSGPYILDEVKQGDRLTLKRSPDYWGAGLKQNIGRYNFDKIVFKAVPDYNVQFEMFKRGDIDYYYFLISKMWATGTNGPLFQKAYVKKLKAENLLPYGTAGVVWNLRRPLFQDKKVRLALSHLMNIDKFIKDLFYNNYVHATGTIHTRSKYHSSKLNPISYDPPAARKLLKEEGWEKVGSDGVLLKGGQRFEFDILVDNPSMERPLTVFQEDLEANGHQDEYSDSGLGHRLAPHGRPSIRRIPE